MNWVPDFLRRVEIFFFNPNEMTSHNSFQMGLICLPARTTRKAAKKNILNSLWYFAIWSTCHCIHLPKCKAVILSNCNFIKLIFYDFVNTSFCHFLRLFFYQLAILQSKHFFKWAFCPIDILSTCHFIKLSF